MAACANALSRTVALRELVSTCVDACGRGCARIRDVQQSGDLGAQLKIAGDARSALTAADVAAQAAIVGSLRRAWPGLRVVGEEDDAAVGDGDAELATPLRTDLCGALPDERADLDDVIVYVDPLDGTREFVEGRLDKVQSLVGVAVRGRPAGGAVGRPFSDEGVVFALRGSAGGLRAAADRGGVVVVSGDSDDALLAVALDAAAAAGATRAVAGATGHKLLAVAEGRADLAVLHRKTCSWDTCAGDPVLASVGGKVTDYFGAPLVYGGDASNALGVVASSPRGAAAHDAVCAAMRAAPEALSLLPGPVAGGDHAADVARDVAGAPLAPADLEALFPGRTLASFRAPEREAARGALSNGCRLRLTWADGGEDSVFYKRVVMAELPAAVKKQATQPAKLLRDVESFRVEAAFLASAAASSFEGVRLPAALASTQLPDAAHPIDSRFALYLRDFAPEDGWRQRNLLSGDDARRTVRALAAFHARYWGADASSAGDVWPRGGHWLPEYAPDQFAAIASAWPRLLASFGAEFAAAPALKDVDLPTLGARLEAAAAAAAARAHPPADAPGRTLIHGDLKAANVFVSDDEVALIDFQFVGWGLAATDLAHFVCCAVDGGDLLDGGDAALVGAYKAALREALVGAGRAADDAAKILEGFDDQFDAGVVDIARLVFAYQWPRIDASPANLRAHAHVAARNSYNKNVDNAVWLVARADAALRRFAAPVKERTWPKWQDDLPSGGL